MLSQATRLFVRERANARCEYCRAPQVITGASFHIDHIVPSARGGSDLAENLALSCITCNSHKSDHTSGYDPATGHVSALFNPRRERWERHFRFTPRTFELSGATAKGRATVARLGMNEPKQIEARALWVALELYP